MRKMIHVATIEHTALQALARETGRTFQELIDEAISDVLKKHKRPVTLKEMLRDSLASDDDAPKSKVTKIKPKRRAT